MGNLGWGANTTTEAEYQGLVHNPPRPKLVLFIHGIGGAPDKSTWASFPQLLADDPDLSENYDIALFGYDTSVMNIIRTPSVSGVAEFLHAKINTDYSDYTEIVIIAHSQGGLIARRYIADRLKNDDPTLKVRRVLYFATPHSGALAASIITSTIDIAKAVTGWPIPGASRQARDLAIGSKELQLLYLAEKATQAPLKIRTKFVVAHEDALVDKTAAWGSHGPGDYFLVPEHGHISIVKPENTDHPAFKITLAFLQESSPGPADLTKSDFNPPLLETKARDTNTNKQTHVQERFVYRARFLPFFGRESQEKTIGNFLGRADKRFSWLLLHGSGGVGKSRLALEVVLAQQSGWWHAGFLDIGELNNRNWKKWQPLQPTFMVIDYVSKSAAKVAAMLNGLADRDPSQPLRYPVRVLLIERDPQGAWQDEIKKAFTDIDIGESRADDLLLVALKDSWPIFKHVWSDVAQEKRKTFPKREKILNQLKKIDDQERPLFAFLIADAIKREGHVRKWDKTALLKNILTHEKKIWGNTAEALKLDENFEPEQWALALATMCNGLSIDNLKNEVFADILPNWQRLKHPKLFAAMSGPLDDGKINAFEPDILGEFFVLELLKTEEDLAKDLSIYAWYNFPLSMAQFTDRCRQDFLSHEALKILVNPKPKNFLGCLLWSMVAINFINAYGGAGKLLQAQSLYDDLKVLAKDHKDEAEIVLAQANGTVNLINAYGGAGKLLQAQSLYDDLKVLAKDHEDNAEFVLRQAMGAVNLISAYGGAGKLLQAQSLYDDLKVLAKDHNDKAEIVLRQAMGAVNLIYAYGDAGQFSQAQILHDDLKVLATDHEDNAEFVLHQVKGIFNLINDYCGAGKLLQAQSLYDDLKVLVKDHEDNAELVLIQVNGMFNLINAYGGAGKLLQAQSLYDDLKVLATDHEDNAEVALRQAKCAFNLINAYCGAGKLLRAQSLYDDLKVLATDHEDNAEVVLRQAKGAVNLINAYGGAGQFSQAQNLYDDLKVLAKDHEDNAVIVLLQAMGAVNLNSAYGGAGQFSQAQNLYDDLKVLAKDQKDEAGIQLTLAQGAFNLINAYGGAGKLSQAESLYDDLKDLATDHEDNAEVVLQQANGAINLINYYCGAGHFSQAQSLYDDLKVLASKIENEKIDDHIKYWEHIFQQHAQSDRAQTIGGEAADEQSQNEIAPSGNASGSKIAEPSRPFVRIVQGITLLILVALISVLALTCVVIVAEETVRAAIDALGGSPQLHALVDLVKSGLKNMP